MKYINLFLYNWKASARHPLSELLVYFKIILVAMHLLILASVFVVGLFLKHRMEWITSEGNDKLSIFSYVLFSALIIDSILKFFVKKERTFPPSLRRFPGSKRKLSVYMVAKEMLSDWNFYLLVFFFPYITTCIQPIHGTAMSVFLFSIVYVGQLLITQLVFYLNKKNHSFPHMLLYVVLSSAILFTLFQTGLPYVNSAFLHISFPIMIAATSFVIMKNNSLNKYENCATPQANHISVWKITISSTNNLLNYIFFIIKMITRSSLLRKQLISYIILTVFYLYLYNKLSYRIEMPFLFNIISILLISTFFPLIFNQYLFSAEATFFDHFMILPRFKNILTAKYILCICMSIIPTLILFILAPVTFKDISILMAVWLYAVGVITLMSFSSLLVADTKIDLSTSCIAYSSPPLGQSLVILAVYSISIITVVVSSLISIDFTIYFMLAMGGTSIAASRKWLNFLYKKFYSMKYDKLEKFREQ